MTLRVMDLFSGIGGFSYGLKKAGGFKTVAYCEIEPYCQAVLLARMRDGWLDTAPIHSDITKLDGRPWRERVDVVTGGFPCQDISVAGKRAGIDGARSGLWKEMGRIICELRPRYVVVENVANVLGLGLGRILGDLASLGYDAEWHIISAADLGAPHLRERLWIVAYSYKIRLPLVQQSSPERGVCTHHQERDRSIPLEVGSNEQLRADQDAWNPPADPGKEREQRIFQGSVSWVPEFSWCKDVRRIEDLRGRSDLPPPLFRGTCDGIPAWVERIGALGNSIVPQIAEWIGKRILETA